MNTPALRLEAVEKRYTAPDGSALTVLAGVGASFGPGETVAIVGPSGSGKSTLLNIIGALEPPTNGRVFLGEVEVSALQGEELSQYRCARVGFVFQDHHLLPQLTALENVLLPSLGNSAPDGSPRSEARELLERVGLSARQDAFPAQLSGGERQRVAVARALINRPGLLLCDEPTGNLDQTTGAEVVSLLLELAAQHGVTVLMVTHNTQQAARFGRRLELAGGRLQPHAAGGETA